MNPTSFPTDLTDFLQEETMFACDVLHESHALSPAVTTGLLSCPPTMHLPPDCLASSRTSYETMNPTSFPSDLTDFMQEGSVFVYSDREDDNEELANSNLH